MTNDRWQIVSTSRTTALLGRYQAVVTILGHQLASASSPPGCALCWPPVRTKPSLHEHHCSFGRSKPYSPFSDPAMKPKLLLLHPPRPHYSVFFTLKQIQRAIRHTVCTPQPQPVRAGSPCPDSCEPVGSGARGCPLASLWLLLGSISIPCSPTA